MVKDGKAKKSNSAEPVSDSPLPETSDVVVNPLLSDQLLKKSDGWYLMGNLNLLYLGLACEYDNFIHLFFTASSNIYTVDVAS